MGWKDEGEKLYQSLNLKQKRYLDKSVDREADFVMTMATDDLRRRFKAKRPKNYPPGLPDPVANRRLVSTLMWQLGCGLLSKEVDIRPGNVRGLWYKWSDKLYTNNGLYDGHSMEDTEYYRFLTAFEQLNALEQEERGGVKVAYVQDLTEDCLADLVRQQIFSYTFFKRVDPDSNFRLIGRYASRIFFVEKRGLFELCQRYSELYGLTGYASDGQPSLLAVEYLANELRKKKVRNVAIAALADWDPWGALIVKALGDKLGAFGIKSETTPLTSLSLFTEETLSQGFDLSHFRPGSSQAKMVDDWMAAGGGIHGEKKGLHVNDADQGRMDAAVRKWWQAHKP